ncbi:MAG: hypothetical protein HQM03_16930, partial [Magnetococcales bacterium]|nr:hypothetical protein [Magnetococcales bacterium]
MTDKAFVLRYYNDNAIIEGVRLDGFDFVKVATRFGIVRLARQVCENCKNDYHILPGNEGLPTHRGQITTRGLQEWICLLPQDVSFATSQRLLGWLTGDPETVSETQIRRCVAFHGQLIRDAERAEVNALLALESLDGLQAQMASAKEIRHPAAWDLARDDAIKIAINQQNSSRPEGVSSGDWERVLKARSNEQEQQKLRRLGPEVRPGEVVAGTDDVCVRRPESRSWL